MEFVDDKGTVIIIDAGSGIRSLGNELLKRGCKNITLLLTHAHWDHILGFPFFKPLYDSSVEIRVLTCPQLQEDAKSVIDDVMRTPYFPITLKDMPATLHFEDICAEAFQVGEFTVETVPLSHPDGGHGFKISQNDKSAVFLTDNELSLTHPGGLSFDEYAAFAEGADLLIHDAEFTKEEYIGKTRGWGHSHVPDAVSLAMAANAKSFALHHHNQDRSDEGVDALVEEARAVLKENGKDMKCFGLTQTTSIRL
jgi:ribonuclease BN (tRNA processing enzyme)